MDNEFHAVDFMRQVRSDLSQKYMQDKDRYLQDLKTAMEDFKRKQEKANCQQCIQTIGAGPWSNKQ
jgi:hypothetical protein